MSDLITAQQAAEICGVSLSAFRSARKGVGAPDAINSRYGNQVDGKIKNTAALYDRQQYLDWASKNDFWTLASDYKHFQRTGHHNRVLPIRKRSNKKPDALSEEVGKHYEQIKLSQPLKDFLLGRFAPAPVRVSQDMKLLRAKLNKPKSFTVSVNNHGWL